MIYFTEERPFEEWEMYGTPCPCCGYDLDKYHTCTFPQNDDFYISLNWWDLNLL